MPKNTFQHIAVWGFGREGQAGLAYLKDRYPSAQFTVIDKAQDPQIGKLTFLGEVDAAKRVSTGYFDLIFKSPGVSLYREEVQAAIAAGTTLTSGTNLWFEAHPNACVVGVTGTKGKSTTASLIHHMLQKCGIKSVLAGNIGTPLLEVEPAEVCVVELSSYQIADLNRHPEIAVLTNLYEAHLEWHGDKAQYHADKMRVFTLSDDTTAIIYKDDEDGKRYLNDKENVLYYSQNTGDLDVPDFLQKPHNLKNISAALSVVEALNALSRLPQNALNDFKPLPHRQEIIGERNDVTFINDSISTVPEAVVVAIEAFADRPISLILGGEEKHQDYGVVSKAIEKHGNVCVFCVPDSGGRIATEIDGAVLCDDMKSAVESSTQALPDGGYVLLSPGTPSFPLYKNYAERGDDFRSQCGF